MKGNIKLKLAAALCAFICLGLVACGDNRETSNESEKVDMTAESSLSASENDTEEESVVIESDTDEKAGADESSETEDSESSDESQEDSDSEDSSEDNDTDIDTGENKSDNQYMDILSPAPMGEWIRSAVFNGASSEYETIYWRILSVNTDAQADVDAYNNGNHLFLLDEITNDDLAYFSVDYEVKYPEEFTESSFGISASSINISVKNPEGGAFKKDGVSYIGLGSCYDVTSDVFEKSDGYPHGGDIVKNRAVFAMIADDFDYVFCFSYTDIDGERKESFAASR